MCSPRSGTHLLRNAAKERRRKLFGLKLVPTYLVDGTLCEMRLEHILPRLLHPVFHINARSSLCLLYRFPFLPSPSGLVKLLAQPARNRRRRSSRLREFCSQSTICDFYLSSFTCQTDGNFQLDLQS